MIDQVKAIQGRRLMWAIAAAACALALGGCSLSEYDAEGLTDGRSAAQRQETPPFGMSGWVGDR